MDSLSNLWKHPKTSAAGFLIALVTISGVLSQQGISLGKAGTGTVVSLVGALATALLGMLAKDPADAASTPGQTSKLGAVMLILLLLQSPFVTGCTGASVACDIVNWTPELQSAVATVDTAAALIDPAYAPIFVAATAGFDAASNLLVAEAKAYLANPNATTLQQLQTAVVTLQQQVNTALLQAVRITNPNSQQHALNTINAVGTVVNAMLAALASVSSKSAVASMKAQASVKLASVRTLEDESQTARMVARHYGLNNMQALVLVNDSRAALEQAGF